jgi:hypothetical protein
MTFAKIIAALREKYPQLIIMDFPTGSAIIKPSIDWLACLEFAVGDITYKITSNELISTAGQAATLISQLQLLREVQGFIESLAPMPLPICFTYEEFQTLVNELGKRVEKPQGGGWAREIGDSVKNIIKPQFDRWVTVQNGCESNEEQEDEWNCYGIKGPLREAVIDVYRALRSDYDGVELNDLTLRRR